jgi:H+-transporting ATPase
LTLAGALMGLGELFFCTAILTYGKYAMRLDLDALRTLAFVAIVFGNQATTYNNRERRHLWASRPSAWVMASSGADILIAAVLSVSGIAMAPLPGSLVLGTLVGAAAFAVSFDFVKVPSFRRLSIN